MLWSPQQAPNEGFAEGDTARVENAHWRFGFWRLRFHVNVRDTVRHKLLQDVGGPIAIDPRIQPGDKIIYDHWYTDLDGVQRGAWKRLGDRTPVIEIIGLRQDERMKLVVKRFFNYLTLVWLGLLFLFFRHSFARAWASLPQLKPNFVLNLRAAGNFLMGVGGLISLTSALGKENLRRFEAATARRSTQLSSLLSRSWVHPAPTSTLWEFLWYCGLAFFLYGLYWLYRAGFIFVPHEWHGLFRVPIGLMLLLTGAALVLTLLTWGRKQAPSYPHRLEYLKLEIRDVSTLKAWFLAAAVLWPFAGYLVTTRLFLRFVARALGLFAKLLERASRVVVVRNFESVILMLGAIMFLVGFVLSLLASFWISPS